MGTAVQFRRGSTVEHSTFVGLDGEITVDNTKKVAVVHDGSTTGGIPMAKASDVTAVSNSLSNKVDVVVGKGLSTNDFTNGHKAILDNLGSVADFEASLL